MRQMSRRVALLGVNKVREFGRIPQEENGSIVGDDVPVSLVRLELYRETAGVSGNIVRSRFSTDCRKANRDGACFAFGAEQVGQTKVVDGIGALEDTVSATAFGMDDTLRDTFTIEMGQKVNQVEVLEQKGTGATSSLCFVRMSDGSAVACGVDRVRSLHLSILKIRLG